MTDQEKITALEEQLNNLRKEFEEYKKSNSENLFNSLKYLVNVELEDNS